MEISREERRYEINSDDGINGYNLGLSSAVTRVARNFSGLAQGDLEVGSRAEICAAVRAPHDTFVVHTLFVAG